MTPSRQGSFHLFRLLQVDVYLHWSWFLVAIWRLAYYPNEYGAKWWPAVEYGSLFAIVLLHEYGHALACRSVGGKADQIVLWPLGGVAFVDAPQRPGAQLWSIAAGPLVNVILFPIFFLAWILAGQMHCETTHPDFYQYLTVLWYMDAGLFIFNMLPIYPLDGGQILRSLLWYGVGRARSLMAAAAIGFVAVVLLLIFAIRSQWLMIMGAFVLFNCWGGLRQAWAMSKMEKAPRRAEQACPNCHVAPPIGEFWTCARCKKRFDIFAAPGICPHCQAQYGQVRCPDCGQLYGFRL